MLLYDLETQRQLYDIDLDQVQDIAWKNDSSCLATVHKDNKLRVCDPRSKTLASVGDCHNGVKPSRIEWLKQNVIFSTGFNSRRDREYGLWDPRSLDRPLTISRLDSSTGVLIPLYDCDTNLIYLIGKADTSIRWLEYRPDHSNSLELSLPFGCKSSLVGACLLPKISLNHMKCEIARLYCVPSENNCIFSISNTIPRKSYLDFQSDLFPDTAGLEYGMTVNEWQDGKQIPRPLVSLAPKKEQPVEPKESIESSTTTIQNLQLENIPSPRKLSFLPKHSLYRHVLGTSHVKYESLNSSSVTVSPESNGFEVNKLYFAFFITGPGGRIGVWPIEKEGRFPQKINCIMHGSDVNDVKFSPFDPKLLATGGEDGKLNIFKIPDVMDKDVFEPHVSIQAHKAKITQIIFHPSVSDVIASASPELGSPMVKLFNLKTLKTICEIPQTDRVVSMAISDQKLVTLQKSVISLYEIPSGKEAFKTQCHDRSVKVVICGDAIVSIGYSSQREIAMYNDKLQQVHSISLDNSPSVIIPYYDMDTKILTLAGRGEAAISFYEVEDDKITELNRHAFPSGGSTVGVSFLPKRYCDVDKVEIMKGYRLCHSHIETLSVTVPRLKKEYFQDDIFCPTIDVEKSALSVNEWLDGKKPKLEYISLENGRPLLSSIPVEVKVSRKPTMERTTRSEKDQKEATMQAMFEMAQQDESTLPQDLMQGCADDEWD